MFISYGRFWHQIKKRFDKSIYQRPTEKKAYKLFLLCRRFIFGANHSTFDSPRPKMTNLIV